MVPGTDGIRESDESIRMMWWCRSSSSRLREMTWVCSVQPYPSSNTVILIWLDSFGRRSCWFFRHRITVLQYCRRYHGRGGRVTQPVMKESNCQRSYLSGMKLQHSLKEEASMMVANQTPWKQSIEGWPVEDKPKCVSVSLSNSWLKKKLSFACNIMRWIM